MVVVTQDGMNMLDLTNLKLKILDGERFAETCSIVADCGDYKVDCGEYKTVGDCKLVYEKIMDALHLKNPYYIFPKADAKIFNG